MEDIILSKKTRDYEVENYGIKLFAKHVKKCLSEEEIRNTLSDNGFNGIYMLSEDEFHMLKDESVSAYYEPDSKVIIVNSEHYKKHPDIIAHELLHAYLNCKSSSSINVDESVISYGYGLEEGCCMIIQKASNINNIDNCVANAYHYQTHLVKQLNELYKYSYDKKYPNLIHHLLKEPDDFLPAIARIYESILDKLGLGINVRNMALRSAFAIVTSSDSMVEDKKYDFYTMHAVNNSINTVYLYLANAKIRNGEENNDLFSNYKEALRTNEETLLYRIFGNDANYFERQVKVISRLLIVQQEEIEKYSETSEMGIKSKKKA